MQDFKMANPDNSEEQLNRLQREELWVLIDSNVSPVLKALSLKYDEINSFQELLTILFNHLLLGQVSQYSYGSEWILTKFDGNGLVRLDKEQRHDNRTLAAIGLRRNDVLLLRKL